MKKARIKKRSRGSQERISAILRHGAPRNTGGRKSKKNRNYSRG